MNVRRLSINALMRLAPVAAVTRLEPLVRHNLAALLAQVRWVAARPAIERLFRFQSPILPGLDHPGTAHLFTPLRAEIEAGLAAVGTAARAGGVRLSFHPAQHAILATSDAAFANARTDIETHAELFAMMGYGGGWHPHGAHVNIHGGAARYGVEGLRHGLARLSAAARDLITIENDENAFGLDDLLEVADACAIVVDLHHHWIRSRGEWLEPDDPRVARVIASWRGVRPVAHVSQSPEALIGAFYPDTRPDFAQLEAHGWRATELRAHSSMMWNAEVNRLVMRHMAWADFEVEAKGKNLASAALAAFATAQAVSPSTTGAGGGARVSQSSPTATGQASFEMPSAA